MARFWKRDEDRSIERALRAHRPEPRDEFAASVLSQIDQPAPSSNRTARSPRRVGLALGLTVFSLAVGSALGGISAASAGLGGVIHVAGKAVHHPSDPGNGNSNSKNDKGNKGDNGNNGKGGDKGGKGNDGHHGDDGDHDDHHGHDGDHHQYKVGVCHWANHKYVLIYVSPQGAANHLKHHPKDKLPVNGHC